MAKYRKKFADPCVAAARGYLDNVVEPRLIRPCLIDATEMLSSKRDATTAQKHGNIPL